MRRIAHFFETILSVSFLAILFTSLLIGANFFISQSFAQTVTAHGISQTDEILRAPAILPEPAYCKNLTDLTCQSENYASRRMAILEYSGRCLRDESTKVKGDFVGYISMVEAKVLRDPKSFRKFFSQIKAHLVRALKNELALSPTKKKEFAARLESLQWLSASDHIKMGGIEEFKRTCGEWGMEENASYTVFADNTHYVVVCPGRFITALEKSTGCYSSHLDLSSMIYTLSHEMGHSIGGNFFSYDQNKKLWIRSDDKAYLGFQTCMKEKFSEFPQKDYGEASADYWASKAMASYFEQHKSFSQNLTFKNTMAGLCGTTPTSRHLPGNIRIQNLIGGQKELRTQLGCQTPRDDRTCKI